jgi:3-dehydroquinate synthase
MVDSSVGGKTGVNFEGKNLVGAFWQPSLVVADLAALATLPPRELRCGLAEVIKHGAILDHELFERLERDFVGAPRAACAGFRLGIGPRLSLDMARLAVQRSCELKGAVVAEDEREAGKRAWLNFGHTFGHALEAVGGLGRLHHGEAVAIGMMLAARLGVRRGDLPASVEARLGAVLRAVGLPTGLPSGTDPDEVLALMYRDKKVRDGRLTLTLLRRLGEAMVVSDTPPALVREVLAEGAT